jgi:superfamily I DNA/RNA helicase
MNNLNELQRKAVEFSGRPLIVTAGPGTGKTKTLIAKIEYLIDKKNVDPSKIAAITFTNKAASEMKERLGSRETFVGTFHSLGIKQLGIEEVPLIYKEDQEKLVSEILKDLNRDLSPRDAILWISNQKNSIFDANDELTEAYNNKLQEISKWDYDDILLNWYKADNKFRYDFVLVDEFQDTNQLQFELLKKISKRPNIMVIGDSNQSIYSFRGAGTEMFQAFKNEFPDNFEINLVDNYRSAPEILTASNYLFSVNLVPTIADSGLIRIVETSNPRTEARYIVNYIQSKVGSLSLEERSLDESNGNFSDIAIFYRTHSQSRELVQALSRSNIPFQVIGEGSLYEKPIIRFFLNLLRNILKETELSLSPFSLKDAQKEFQRIKEQLQKEKVSTTLQTIEGLFKLKQRFPKDSLSVDEFIGLAVRFDNQKNGVSSLMKYIDKLSANEYYDPSLNAVILSTLHAAKGLEFPFVCICGFEEGLIPLKKSSVEEEKRLLYVGITRGEREVTLIYTKERYKRPTKVSSFYALLNQKPVVIEPDTVSQEQQKKQISKRAKKAQLSLW